MPMLSPYADGLTNRGNRRPLAAARPFSPEPTSCQAGTPTPDDSATSFIRSLEGSYSRLVGTGERQVQILEGVNHVDRGHVRVAVPLAEVDVHVEPPPLQRLDLAEGRDLVQEFVVELVFRQQGREVAGRVVLLVVARGSRVRRLKHADSHGSGQAPAPVPVGGMAVVRVAEDLGHQADGRNLRLQQDLPDGCFLVAGDAAVRVHLQDEQLVALFLEPDVDAPVSLPADRLEGPDGQVRETVPQVRGRLPEPVERLALGQARLFLVFRPVPVVAEEPFVAGQGGVKQPLGRRIGRARRAARACPPRRGP